MKNNTQDSFIEVFKKLSVREKSLIALLCVSMVAGLWLIPTKTHAPTVTDKNTTPNPIEKVIPKETKIFTSKEKDFSLEFYCQDFCNADMKTEYMGYFDTVVNLTRSSQSTQPHDIELFVGTFTDSSTKKWEEETNTIQKQNKGTILTFVFPNALKNMNDALSSAQIGDSLQTVWNDKKSKEPFTVVEIGGKKALLKIFPDRYSYFIPVNEGKFIEIYGYKSASAQSKNIDIKAFMESTIKEVKVLGS